jgi:hypothetical protein
LRGHGVNGQAIQTPNAIELNEQHLVLNLQRPRREVAHEVKLVPFRHLRLLREVRGQEQDGTQIDAAAAQICKNRSKPRLIEALAENWRAEIAQHGIIARLVRVLHRHDGGFDEGDELNRLHLSAHHSKRSFRLLQNKLTLCQVWKGISLFLSVHV